MSSLNDALSKVVLTDILAQPTEEKDVIFNSSNEETQINENDFSDHVQQMDFPANNQQPIEPIEPPIDPRVEATKLVNLLSAGNNLATVPLATWKLNKNRGGKQVIEKMKASYIKQRNGVKLTEEETIQAESYKQYEADKSVLLESLPYTDAQMNTLIEVAIPYCEANQLKINGSFAFWGVFAGVQMDKVIKILTA